MKLEAGMVIGRWTLIRKVPQPKGLRNSKWECICSCGEKKNVWASGFHNGNTKSCGCASTEQKETQGGASREHPKLFRVYCGMKHRCFLKTSKAYPMYGGRGITICPRWQESFKNFMEDMGQSPKGMTLERLDNDGPYSKENCVWASRKDQAQNRRSTVFVTLRGHMVALAKLADKVGINLELLRQRIERGVMTVEEAISRPIGKNGRRKQ